MALRWQGGVLAFALAVTGACDASRAVGPVAMEGPRADAGRDAPVDLPAATSDGGRDVDPPVTGGLDANRDVGLSVGGPSCTALPATCGPNRDQNCCAAGLIPGGSFLRSNDAAARATVGAFRLDDYEVTVGRFRRFVADYAPGSLPRGAGRNRKSLSDAGWEPNWTTFYVPKTAAALAANLNCDATATWTDAPGPNEDRPLNCLDWYTAFAFCVWDGGRLPTEAEWNYAAAGGDEQRPYPWSSSANDQTISPSHASYAMTDLLFVGSKSPTGDGRWGQADLAGNVSEWTADGYGNYRTPCIDCQLFAAQTADEVHRGGAFYDPAMAVTTAARAYDRPSITADRIAPQRFRGHGARCARDLAPAPALPRDGGVDGGLPADDRHCLGPNEVRCVATCADPTPNPGTCLNGEALCLGGQMDFTHCSCLSVPPTGCTRCTASGWQCGGEIGADAGAD